MTPLKVTTGPLKVLSAISILVLGLALGLVFDLLVREQSPGIGLVLFVALACCSVPLVRRPRRTETYVLLAASWSLAAWAMVRDASYLIALDICAATLLASLAVSSEVYDQRVWLWRLRDHVGSWFDQSGAMIRGATKPVAGLLRERDRVCAGKVLPYLRGVLIAVPVFAVFAALLAASDMVFNDFLNEVIPDIDLSLGTAGTHIFWIVAAGWVGAGILTFALQPDREPAGGEAHSRWAVPVVLRPSAEHGERRVRIGYVEAMIVLGSVTALLALFVGFQFAYLFRGAAQIELPGVTYAEYARAGFFQLIAVAVLVAGMIWLAIRIAVGERPDRRFVAFRAICSLMIVLTAVILVSALTRLGLYEDAYGLTRLRLLSHVFIFWIAGVLALLLAQAFWTHRHLFVSGVVALAFTAWFAVNLINPDAYIVNHNLDRVANRGATESAHRYDERLTSELEYLASLSADGVPAFVERYRSGAIVMGGRDSASRSRLKDWLCDEISDYESWREWNRGRSRAAGAVAGLNLYDPGNCFRYRGW